MTQGRFKQSLAHAEATGATVHNPQRYSSTPKLATSSKLGEPPSEMLMSERVIWEELRANYPWLCETDRYLVEQLCHLIVLHRTDGLENSERTLLIRLLTHIGGTPTTRSRIPDEKKEEADDFAEFLN